MPIWSKRPAVSSADGASHEPPHAITLGTASQSPSRSSVMPPVGLKHTPAYGADSARRYGTPPIGSAGKNFTVVTPSSSAASMSLGVQTPGSIGTPRSTARRTTFGSVPGATSRCAPAVTACSACAVVSTVPATIVISGTAAARAAIASRQRRSGT